MKKGPHAVITTNNDKSDAFKKAREPVRIQSIDEGIDDNEEILLSTSTQEDTNWDKVQI